MHHVQRCCTTWFELLLLFDSISIFARRLFVCTEYAAVGYIAKRIEMRKKRYQNLQKLAEQRRAAMAINAGGAEGDQTASTVAKNVSSFFFSFLLSPIHFHRTGTRRENVYVRNINWNSD